VKAEAGGKHEYGSIDRFRIIAALMIVGIHTYPLASVSEAANFYIVHVLGRVAVPFFLMVTGYFLLPRYIIKKECDTGPLIKFIKKTGLIYALATLLYLPISIYAGHYSGGNLFAVIIRNIVFDGTFYHLWYLPASIIGVLIVYALGRRFSLRVIFITAAILYIVGLLGDNYFGVIYGIPLVRNIYDIGFNVFSFTRNGLFYAPVFLVMGAAMAMARSHVRAGISIVGLAVSLSLMMFEGYILQRSGYSRHSSMYIALLPSMFFLFNLLLIRDVRISHPPAQRGKASVLLRNVSMWVFILHPLFIIVVRGLARGFGLTHLLVGNSVVHFIVVCVLSVAASVFCTVLHSRYKGRAYV